MTVHKAKFAEHMDADVMTSTESLKWQKYPNKLIGQKIT